MRLDSSVEHSPVPVTLPESARRNHLNYAHTNAHARTRVASQNQQIHHTRLSELRRAPQLKLLLESIRSLYYIAHTHTFVTVRHDLQVLSAMVVLR